jgi:post-segregation antitoxin (ccd killing protein)
MRMTVHVDNDLAQRALEIAKEEGVSVSSLYARALERHLKELRRTKAIAYMNSLVGKTYVAETALEILHKERKQPERVIK